MRDRNATYALLAAAALFAFAAPLSAQEQPVDTMHAEAPAPGEGEVRLVYEREVFDYTAGNRRDPFRPLVGANGQVGPTFQDLALSGIIYATGRGQSVALVRDRSGKVYRAHKGDIIGNATVLEIRPLEVLFAVEDFGVTRQEMLRLKSDKAEGA